MQDGPSIVFVSDELQRGGGAARTELELAAALASRGTRVSLAFLRAGERLVAWQGFGARATRVVFRRVPGDGLTSLPRWAWNTAGALGAALRLGRIPRDEIIVSLGHDEIFSAAVIAAARRSPLVVLICSPASWRGPVDQLPLWRRIGYRCATGFVPVAEHVARDWCANGLDPRDITVVHTGLDADAWAPLRDDIGADLRSDLGIPAHARVVLYVGRFDPIKGLGVLAEAVGRMPGVHLVAVGMGEDPGSDGGHAFVDQLRLACDPERLHLCPASSEVRPWYALADAVVVPSLIKESFSRVVLEALSCERPVVASDIGGSREVLVGEFAGWRYPPEDVDQLRATLLDVLDWRADDPDLGRRCRRLVAERFSMDPYVENFLDACLSALNRRRSLRTALRRAVRR